MEKVARLHFPRSSFATKNAAVSNFPTQFPNVRRKPPTCLRILCNITRSALAGGPIPRALGGPQLGPGEIGGHFHAWRTNRHHHWQKARQTRAFHRPPTAKVSFEDSGTILRSRRRRHGTYTSVIGAEGSPHGEGQGIEMTADGEAATWTGTGVGKFGPGGSVSYRGMLLFRTTSQKLARLNNACVAFEYDVDAAGATVSKMWE